MKRVVFSVFLIGLGLTYLTQPVNASIVLSASGVSAKGVEVTFTSQLTIAGDFLTVELINDSPVDGLNPDDALGSFYFDILDGSNNRPNLTLTSAVGDVYLTHKTSADELIEASADLIATAGSNKWVFKVMDATQNPFLGFGIGTVGNSNLNPNGFPGNFVDGISYAIHKGEVTTANLNNTYLVKEMATFTFTGLTGFTEGDISDVFAFGLGTAPDSLLAPEPTTICLLGLGGLIFKRKH